MTSTPQDKSASLGEGPYVNAPQPAAKRSIELTQSQRDSVKKLSKLIKGHLLSKSQFLSHEEKFATFALFGSRGSGKSTIMEGACHELLQWSKGKGKGKIFLCWPPFDCSTLSPRIPLGIGIVAHIHRLLQGEEKDNDQLGQAHHGRIHERRIADAEETAWNEFLGKYVQLDSRHQALEMSLAVSALEYQDIATRELDSRGVLGKEIELWLKSACQKVGAEKILVPIEDCDLSEQSFSPEWLGAFLDELATPRLLFLIVADERHIDEMVRRRFDANGSGQVISAYTILKLIDKLIPATHRIYLDRWKDLDALKFHFGRTPINNRAGKKGKPEVGATLEERLKGRGQVLKDLPPLRDLKKILPLHPRGLMDLYRGLEGNATESKSDDAREALALIARCRGEKALARSLHIRPLDWWGARLQWSARSLSDVRWAQIIIEAGSGLPIRALKAEFPDDMAHDIPPPGESQVTITSVESQLAWAEVLLNASLRKSSDAMCSLLWRFTPLKERLDVCCFSYVPLPQELEKVARQQELPLFSPWLRLRGSTAPEARIEAGWAPLIDRDLGQNESTLDKILADLAVRLRQVVKNNAAGQLLPADVRSLFLLTDEMFRLPWQELGSWARAREIKEWTLALAVLCGGAYLRVLRDRLRGEEGRVPDYEPPDPVKLLEMSREDLDAEVRRLPEGSDFETFDHPMAVAAGAFFSMVKQQLSPSS